MIRTFYATYTDIAHTIKTAEILANEYIFAEHGNCWPVSASAQTLVQAWKDLDDYTETRYTHIITLVMREDKTT